ncbi:MAG: preprotein translocase subunit SecE [Lachnospiraceae bacterium]|nr:preprotein translocase subunit SecE [Lachnospiraceae bacterium]
MAENNEKAPKTSFFDGLKVEFRKINWPTRDTLVKQTAAVVVASVVVGLIISLLDSIIQYGINFLVNL